MPRTEQEILKDFEKLGYRATKSNVRLKLRNKKSCISIMFETKTINCYKPITIQEHKLLHELFTAWRWLKEDLSE